MSDIIVTGTIDFDPSKRDSAVAAVTEMMAATMEEEGCHAYTFSADLSDLGRFHLSEHWGSQGAMDAHMASAHMAALMGKMGDMGVTGVSITKWEGATGSPLM